MLVYERALKQNKDFWFAANNLAFLLSEQSDKSEDFKRAESLAKSALRLRPGDPSIMDTLGWVNYRLGDYKQAQDLIQQALQNAPDSAILNYHMGMVLYKEGQGEAARAKLEKALDSGEHFIGRDEAERALKELS